MKTILWGAAILALASPAFAVTEIMTFDDVSGNYTPFDDTLGDNANVDVTNRTRTDFGDSVVYEEHLEHWTDNYSELVDIAFPSGDGQVGELQFDVDSGYQITFDSFDFGNYRDGVTPRDAIFRIFDSSWNVVWELVIDDHTGNSVNVMPGVTLTGTSYFQWGTDWDIGIDNFTYTSDVHRGVPAVPLPASLPLLAAGVALLGWRRRSA